MTGSPERPRAKPVLAEILQTHGGPSSSSQQAAPATGPSTTSVSTSYRPGAPLGRLQATDFVPPVPASPALRSLDSPPLQPHESPPLTRQVHGSQASISSLDSQDGLGSVDEDGDNNDLGASVIQLFNPNLYLHAQEAWSQWEEHRGQRGGGDDEESLHDGPAGSSFSQQEEMSERASLMRSSLAHRKAYGTLPSESNITVSSRRMGPGGFNLGGVSAIHAHPHPDEATLVDAMKTADIGGQPGSNLGLILIAISQLCYSIMNLFVTLLDQRDGQSAPHRGPDHPPITVFEIVFAECFIIWIGAIGAMLLFGTPHVFLGPPNIRGLLLLRGLFGFLSTLFLYMSLQALSLSDATALTFLGPLVTGATAALILGEPFTVRERVAGIGSLVGVIMIARPSAIFGTADDGEIPSTPGDTPPIEGDGTDSKDASQRLFGVVIALIGVCCMSGAWISLRKIGRSASTYHSIAYFAGCSWILSLAAMLVLRQPFVLPSDWIGMFLLTTVGVSSLLAQVFQTLGLQRETAGRASMMAYLVSSME
jgi:drug/metabolite transporter (DMT)-like permease